MRDFLGRKFNDLLFTGTPKGLSDFLENNPEIGLELVHLTEDQINAIQSGEEINKFDIDVLSGDGKIPILIDLKSDIIKIHATIHN